MTENTNIAKRGVRAVVIQMSSSIKQVCTGSGLLNINRDVGERRTWSAGWYKCSGW